MALHPITHAKYAFNFVGAPGDDAACALALASNGPLLVAQDHIMSAMLPDALDRHTHAPAVEIKINDVHGAIIAGSLIAADLVGCGLHIALGVTRTAQFMKDIDEAGIDKTPAVGDRKQAWPIIKKRITDCVAALPPAMRTIARADVIIDGGDSNPATATWYDHMTIEMMLSGGGTTRMLAQWLEVVPNAISSNVAGGRGSAEFTNTIGLIEGSLGSDVSTLNGPAIAMLVVNWWQETAPPVGMDPHIEQPMMEIVRRKGKTQAERFRSLFRENWRTYKQLDELWPEAVVEPETDTAALSANLGLTINTAEGLTPQAVSAIIAAMKDFLVFATSDDNASRTAELLRAYKSAASPKEKELTEAEKRELQGDAIFIDFKTKLSAIPISDYTQAAKLMLTHEHPAGILFLCSKMNGEKWLKERAAARTDASLQALFDKEVSVTNKGDEASSWGLRRFQG